MKGSNAGNKTRLPPGLVFLILSALLVTAVIAALGIGSVSVPPATLLRTVLRWMGLPVGEVPAKDVLIVLYLRMPRILSALLVGSALSACGAVMQGLFRNPMASPEVLGISAGGGLGAVIAIAAGLSLKSVLSLPLLTVAGALTAAALIYGISSIRGTTSLLYIVIAGMAISSLFNGITSALLLFSKEHEVSQFIFWTMGGLDGRTWQHVMYSAPLLVPGVVILCFFSRELNVFAFGEESARALGMGVESTKRLLLGICAVMTGAAIAVSGPVGFVGLMIPHLLRMIVGPDHRRLLPASALGGGFFLVVCDLIGRSIAPPFEIRVGIITAVLGSPYLLSLILRSQKRAAA